MLYSQQDIQNARNQLLRRIGLMAALAILPNVAGIVVMYTIRIEWLSVLLGCLGGAMAIFTWGLFCYPSTPTCAMRGRSSRAATTSSAAR